MADSVKISIDEAKAQNWISDVNQEIIEAEAILKNVTECINRDDVESDDMMKAIKQTGEVMKDFWDRMCNGFKKASEDIGKAIKFVHDSAENVIEDVKSVKSKVGT